MLLCEKLVIVGDFGMVYNVGVGRENWRQKEFSTPEARKAPEAVPQGLSVSELGGVSR